MTRVLNVLDESILVDIFNVVAGDVLDLVTSTVKIESVEHKDGAVKFHYDSEYRTKESMWMRPETGGKVFLVDVNNERANFVPKESS